MAAPLAGKLAVVTGATRGLGRAMAARLLADGARVLGTGTAADGAGPSGTEYIGVDLTDAAATAAFCARLATLAPDILINNAGISMPEPIAELSEGALGRTHALNLAAPIRLCRAVVPAMRAKGGGRIVNVASIWGLVGRPGRGAYGSSKTGIDGFSTCLAAEVAAEGILVNCVAPGFFDTDMTRRLDAETVAALIEEVPLGRLGRPEELAALVAWLVGPENAFVTGQNIVIDGGYTRLKSVSGPAGPALDVPLEGRLAVVTGATRGLGRAIAERLRDAGARVVATGTKPDGVPPEGCEYLAVDFDDPAATERFCDRLAALGPQILINNAGIGAILSYTEWTAAAFERVQRINLIAPALACKAVLPRMVAAGWGRIVNVTSVWGLLGRDGRGAYAATKAGLDGLGACLAAEVARQGVLVNGVASGYIATDILRTIHGEDGMRRLRDTVPVKRLAGPADIAALVVWLAGPENGYMTAQNVVIDGGFSRLKPID